MTPDLYRPGTPGYRRIAVALFLAGVATFALLHSTQPLLPELAAQFNLTPQESALSLSLATLGLGVALLVAGPGTELLGRTPLMFASLFLSSVVGIACAFSPNWTTLLVLRTIQGITLAGLPAVATAYLREEVHPSATSRAVGLYIGGTAIGGMSGRLVAGTVADFFGWHAAIGLIGVLGLVCAVTAKALLPESKHFVPSGTTPREVFRAAFKALSDPVLIGLYAISGTLMGGFVATFNAMGFRLAAEPYLLSLGLASLVFLCYGVGSFSSTSAGATADRLGHAKVLPFALGSALVGLAITACTVLPVMILGLLVLTAGFFAAHGIASGWVAVRASERGSGTGLAASLYLFSYYLGSSVFGAFSGVAWAHSQWNGVLLLVGVLWLVALGCAVALRLLARHD